MTQIIVLALDGEAILLRNITVSVSLRLPDKDMSGQSTSTSSAQKGCKAKEMKVTGIVDFNDEKILTRLFQLAEATGNGGDKKCYRIANATARAVNMRQGVFSGSVDVTEQQGKMNWQVSFTLREKLSVPEKKEVRSSEQKTRVNQQTQTGTSSTSDNEQINTQDAFWGAVNNTLGGWLDKTGVGSVKDGE